MPLNPFRNDSTRPSDGAFGVVCAIAEAALAAKLLLFSAVYHSPKQLGPPVPSGGRAEVLWRGAFGMDAKRGAMGQGWPFVTTLGTVPE